MVSYLGLPDVLGLDPKSAGDRGALYWWGAMVGRFIGAYLLNKISPAKLLSFNVIGAAALVLLSISTSGETAMWSLLAVGLMNSIMWPVIFPLALAGLGRHTEEGSGLLCTAVVGGAVVPQLFGIVTDHGGLRLALMLPVLCYLYILWYGLRGSRPVTSAGL